MAEDQELNTSNTAPENGASSVSKGNQVRDWPEDSETPYPPSTEIEPGVFTGKAGKNPGDQPRELVGEGYQKALTNKDLLASQGLVEIFDPTVGARRQVKREDAKAFFDTMKQLEGEFGNE